MALVQVFMITHTDGDRLEETLYTRLSNGKNITTGRRPFSNSVAACWSEAKQEMQGGESIGNYEETNLGVIL